MTLVDVLKTFQDEKVITKVEEGKFVEKDLGGVSLKGVLQRGRLKLIKDKRPYTQGVSFRPASITYGYCRRLKVAQLAGLVDLYDDKVTPKQQLVFDMGHAIHDIIQRYFWEIGILKGTFKCIKCDKLYHDLVAPKECPSGIKSHTKKCLQYKEIWLTQPEYLIRGRSDGVLVIDGEEHVIDIKSIANRALKTQEMQFCFEDLATKGPKDEHVIQLNLYLWMLNLQRGHLLYVSKNDHQIKTFAIPYDYSVIEPFLREIRTLIDASALLRAGKSVTLPAPCGKESCICDTFLSNLAK